MNWTSERPTARGWYWYQEPMCDASIVEVYEEGGALFVRWCDWFKPLDIAATDGNTVEAMTFGGVEWAGPIEAPTDASHPMLIEAERKKRILEKHGYTAADARADDLPEHVREELGLDESDE